MADTVRHSTTCSKNINTVAKKIAAQVADHLRGRSRGQWLLPASTVSGTGAAEGAIRETLIRNSSGP